MYVGVCVCLCVRILPVLYPLFSRYFIWFCRGITRLGLWEARRRPAAAAAVKVDSYHYPKVDDTRFLELLEHLSVRLLLILLVLYANVMLNQ